ncbi:MAG: DUF4388 domain-containing protein [Blastocatellia bacterium]
MKEAEDIDIESVILDAELLIKYNMPDRGIAALENAVEAKPENIQLREKLYLLYKERNLTEKAAAQCMALGGLFVRTGELEQANRFLLEARELNPNSGATIKLQELRKVEQSRGKLPMARPDAGADSERSTLAGSLSDFSIFDVVQLLENNRLTGILALEREDIQGRIYFTEGQIVNATMTDASGMEAFKKIVGDASNGYFDFQKSRIGFAREIEALSNTSLILDLLREYDEEHRYDDLDEDEL